MAYPQYRVVNFGSSKTGLNTVNYSLFQSNNSPWGGVVTTGITELGGGAYGALVTFPDNFIGYIKWSSGEGSPVYAFDEINLNIYPSSNREISSDLHNPGVTVY